MSHPLRYNPSGYPYHPHGLSELPNHNPNDSDLKYSHPHRTTYEQAAFDAQKHAQHEHDAAHSSVALHQMPVLPLAAQTDNAWGLVMQAQAQAQGAQAQAAQAQAAQAQAQAQAAAYTQAQAGCGHPPSQRR
jgi:hypothetical protein